jgi:hypothetical protein
MPNLSPASAGNLQVLTFLDRRAYRCSRLRYKQYHDDMATSMTPQSSGYLNEPEPWADPGHGSASIAASRGLPQHSDTPLMSEIDNFDIQRYGAVSRLS